MMKTKEQSISPWVSSFTILLTLCTTCVSCYRTKPEDITPAIAAPTPPNYPDQQDGRECDPMHEGSTNIQGLRSQKDEKPGIQAPALHDADRDSPETEPMQDSAVREPLPEQDGQPHIPAPTPHDIDQDQYASSLASPKHDLVIAPFIGKATNDVIKFALTNPPPKKKQKQKKQATRGVICFPIQAVQGLQIQVRLSEQSVPAWIFEQ